MMVTYQEEVYCRLKIWNLDSTDKKTGENCHWWSPYHPPDGHPPSQGWSTTIQYMVTNHPKDGHSFSKGWSLTIPWMVTNPPQDGHPPSPRGSCTIQSLVIHKPKEDHPPSSRWSQTVPSIWLHTIHRMVTHNPQYQLKSWIVFLLQLIENPIS